MDRPGGRYFANFISQDGSFFIDPPTIAAIEQQMFGGSNGQLPVGLVMSGAVNYAVMSDLYDKIVSRGCQGLNSRKLSFYPQGHLGTFAPSFTDSVRILYP